MIKQINFNKNYLNNCNMEISNKSLIPVDKKGSGIHIKKKNRGKFTEYCGGEVTLKCIDKAKKSKNPTLRKRATFAANSRKWKHALGGTLVSKYQTGTKENGISLLKEIPTYLLALTLKYQETKPVDSFLGSDYVHNFIQKNKDVMGFDDEGHVVMNSPAYKIDLAYITQSNQGSHIDGVTYNKLHNKQDEKNVSSNTKTLSMSTSTPVHFPNRKSYLKIYNELTGDNAQSYVAHNSYLPSTGNFTLINRGHDFVEQLLEDRDDLYKERSQWIKDLSKPDWFKLGGTLMPKYFFGNVINNIRYMNAPTYEAPTLKEAIWQAYNEDNAGKVIKWNGNFYKAQFNDEDLKEYQQYKRNELNRQITDEDVVDAYIDHVVWKMENPHMKGYNPLTRKFTTYNDSGNINDLDNLGPGIAHTSDVGLNLDYTKSYTKDELNELLRTDLLKKMNIISKQMHDKYGDDADTLSLGNRLIQLDIAHNMRPHGKKQANMPVTGWPKLTLAMMEGNYYDIVSNLYSGSKRRADMRSDLIWKHIITPKTVQNR